LFKRSFLLLTAMTSLIFTGCNNLHTVNISDIKITAGDKITLNEASGGAELTMTEIPGDENKIANFLNGCLRNATIEGTYKPPKNIKVSGLMPNYIGINEGKGDTEIRILQYQTYTTSKLKNGFSVQTHNQPNELVVFMPEHVPIIVRSHALYSLVAGTAWVEYFQSSH